jgi:hypothetical protein
MKINKILLLELDKGIENFLYLAKIHNIKIMTNIIPS